MLRPVTIRHYLAVMRAKGFDAETVLASTGVIAARLEEPGYLIDLKQCQAVIGNMLRLSNEPGLGFDVGLQADLGHLGIVGYAAMSSKTMRETFGLWAQFSPSLVGVTSQLSILREDADSLTFAFAESLSPGEVYRFSVEELLGMFYAFGGLLAGERPSVTQLTLSYAAPPNAQRYQDLFECPVRFNSERTTATVTSRWLDKPLPTNNEEFNKICLQHCGQILQQIKSSGPMIARLRNLFLKHPKTLPKLDDAAQTLGISARSLRRHLLEEGTSYQKLVDEFRADLAGEYLRSTSMSPKEIGYLLGFKEQSAFRRSFKAWTGQTIRQYRAAISEPS